MSALPCQLLPQPYLIRVTGEGVTHSPTHMAIPVKVKNVSGKSKLHTKFYIYYNDTMLEALRPTHQ